ncbi:hypothetical protein Fmac_021396 [Flemingia macrophylla]|uniref:Uncharacterized protein n=1 Tax=Flemingia macrophylla TaxID=520843 RepID=A0ABD1LWV6_9FABA
MLSMSNVHIEPTIVQTDRLNLAIEENYDFEPSESTTSSTPSSASAKSSAFGFADKVKDWSAEVKKYGYGWVCEKDLQISNLTKLGVAVRASLYKLELEMDLGRMEKGCFKTLMEKHCCIISFHILHLKDTSVGK